MARKDSKMMMTAPQADCRRW